ncbi:heat shock protein 67B1 [Cephus cinctus]|uniref:Heat shock protein 67B1 n=1 Tax=Cephus cinctus TaxID=211228 RepID=A0AAJ7CF29_CEPCN|nr:heat shock protein 67B1 [Cephus cinctus]
MSLPPLLYSSWWEGLNRPHYLRDQGFGMGIRPDLTQRQLMDRYYAPLGSDVSGFSTITDDKNVFQVLLDVHLFKPDEIKVKLVDKFVVVEAKHMERQDEHGFVTRQFLRKYVVPDVVDTDLIKAELFVDGILVIMAPVKDVKENKLEKIINIERTGKTFLDTRMMGDTQNFPIGTDRYKDTVVHTTDMDQGLTTGTTPGTTSNTTCTTGTTTGITTPTTTDTTADTTTYGITTGIPTGITTGTTTGTTTGIITAPTTGTLDTMQKLNESKKDSEEIMKDKRRELDEMMEGRRGECMKLVEEKKTIYENLMEEKKKNERVENKLKMDEKKRDERKKF